MSEQQTSVDDSCFSFIFQSVANTDYEKVFSRSTAPKDDVKSKLTLRRELISRGLSKNDSPLNGLSLHEEKIKQRIRYENFMSKKERSKEIVLAKEEEIVQRQTPKANTSFDKKTRQKKASKKVQRPVVSSKNLERARVLKLGIGATLFKK